jgi:hypothetical protein
MLRATKTTIILLAWTDGLFLIVTWIWQPRSTGIAMLHADPVQRGRSTKSRGPRKLCRNLLRDQIVDFIQGAKAKEDWVSSDRFDKATSVDVDWEA